MTMTNNALALAPLCLAALASLTACDPEHNSPYCEDSVTVLDDLDEETPSGLKPAEIIRAIEGERSLEFEYVEQGPDSAVVVELESGEGTTALSLDLQQLGEVRWIESKEVYPTNGGITDAIGIICNDRLEFDAELSLATADGVFDELFAVVVRVAVDGWNEGLADQAQISHGFEPDELDGSFAVTSISPANPTRVEYDLDMAYSLDTESEDYGQPSGSVGGGAEYEMGQTAMWGRLDIGLF